jgi:hypothetical protein
MPDYPLILRSRDSGVSKDRGPEQPAEPLWFETALARLLTMRIYKQNA